MLFVKENESRSPLNLTSEIQLTATTVVIQNQNFDDRTDIEYLNKQKKNSTFIIFIGSQRLRMRVFCIQTIFQT